MTSENTKRSAATDLFRTSTRVFGNQVVTSKAYGCCCGKCDPSELCGFGVDRAYRVRVTAATRPASESPYKIPPGALR